MSQTSLELTRVIKAQRQRVFDAWTQSELIKQWWGPGTTTCPDATIDLQVGGIIEIANQVSPDNVVWIKGQFEEITRPSKLVYSWLMGTSMQKPTRVTVLFNEHPLGTELVLIHERFENAEVRDHHLKGWGGCVDGLVALLEHA